MQGIIFGRISRVARLIALGIAISAGSIIATAATAQVPQPLPTPNVNLLTGGNVYAIAQLADGSVVIGGQFVSVNGTLRSNIAKRLPDGTLDANWHSVIDGDVRALAVDGDGNVYAGGGFDHADGYVRRNLVKISPTGAVVPGWDPSPDGLVEALLVNAAGDAFVGGRFENIGGQIRRRLAKVSTASGAVDPQWNPAPDSAATILALQLSHDGALYVGGQFAGIGGLPQKHIAKVSVSGVGAVDPQWDPSPDSTVSDIAVAADGSVYVTGDFGKFRRAVGGLWLQRNLAKLSGTGSGSIIEGWDPSNFVQVNNLQRVAVGGDGWLYVSGRVPSLFADGTFSQLIRVSQSGTGPTDASWNPRVEGTPYALSSSGAKLLVGGGLYEVGRQTRLGFVALNADASPEAAFDAESPGGAIFAIGTQPDGRLIVSGQFAKANGQLRGGLLRLNSDGSLDLAWNPSPDGFVRSIAFSTDGSAIVGGSFSAIGGQSVNAIAKLSAVDGAADPVWRPNLGSGYVAAVASDNAGRVYAGGIFNYGFSGAPSQRNLVRISDSGAGEVDATWRPDPNERVEELSLDGNGALFVRGRFLTMNGEPRKRIAKLLTTGPTVLDALWKPAPAGWVRQIVADGLGSVFVAGGGFPIAGGGSTASIAKLSASGAGAADPLWKPFDDRLAQRIGIDPEHNSLFALSSTYDDITGINTYYLTKHSTLGAGDDDPAWNPTINSAVANIQVNAGEVLLGGYFTQVSGQQRYGLAALPINVPDVIYASGFDSN